MEHVGGYTIGHDVSARDWQLNKPGKQWMAGKTFDTFAPIGPELVTPDEVSDPHDLGIRLRLNGQTMQDSNTSQLIFGVDYVISYLSQIFTLEPGDLIFTGTPPGVGMARKPPVWLKAGDVVEVEIDGLGTLRNSVVRRAEVPSLPRNDSSIMAYSQNRLSWRRITTGSRLRLGASNAFDLSSEEILSRCVVLRTRVRLVPSSTRESAESSDRRSPAPSALSSRFSGSLSFTTLPLCSRLLTWVDRDSRCGEVFDVLEQLVDLACATRPETLETKRHQQRHCLIRPGQPREITFPDESDFVRPRSPSFRYLPRCTTSLALISIRFSPKT